jgi:hypothetical protein
MITPIEADTNLLLELFKEHVARNLKAKAIAAIEPELDAAVAEAVKSLNAEIMVQMDFHSNEMMGMVLTHKKAAK